MATSATERTRQTRDAPPDEARPPGCSARHDLRERERVGEFAIGHPAVDEHYLTVDVRQNRVRPPTATNESGTSMTTRSIRSFSTSRLVSPCQRNAERSHHGQHQQQR